jgi:hypothetical protein
MSTKTEIGNLALINLGVSQTMTDIDTDDSPEAVVLRTIFTTERDWVLRDFPWPFATAYADLRLIGGNTNERASRDWVYVYQFPSDAIAVRRLVRDTIGRTDMQPPAFARGRNFVFTNEDEDREMTLTTGAGWTTSDTITVTCSESFFNEDDIGNTIRLVSGADVVSITIVTYISATAVSGTPNITVPAALRSTAVDTWSERYTGKLIWTDERDAHAEYTVSITDVTEFDADYVSMFAWRLAYKAAAALPRFKGSQDSCLKGYAIEKARVEVNAMLEGQKDAPPDAEWIRDRLGSGTSSAGDFNGFIASLDD